MPFIFESNSRTALKLYKAKIANYLAKLLKRTV